MAKRREGRARIGVRRMADDPVCDLFAFDMDGTLLSNDKHMDPATIAAVRGAVERGKHAVIASGRGLGQLGEFTQELGAAGFDYLVCCNGATVYDRQGHKLLHGVVDRTDVLLLLEVCHELDVMFECVYRGNGYVQEDQLESIDHWGMGMYHDLHALTALKVHDMRLWMAMNQDGLIKINPHFTNGEIRDQVYERLKGSLKGEMARAEGTSLEISPAGMTKGTGVLWLADTLGIPRRRVGAVGDGENDVPLLRTVGVPVAMGNAVPEVMDVARFVVADNEHGGCTEVVRRFLR